MTTKSRHNPAMQDNHDQNLAEIAINAAGGPAAVGRNYDISAWAVSKWGKSGIVPPKRIPQLCKDGGFKVTPHQLDQEVYPYPQDALPPEVRGQFDEAA